MADQEQHTSESDFMKHLIEAAGMRADINSLQKSNAETNNRMFTILAEVSADIKAMRENMAHVPLQITECRRDLRHEVERDFPSKMETVQMERRIEEQINVVDKTLGKQIAEVSKSVSDQIVAVKDDIKSLNNKVEKQWLKITVIVSTIVTLAMIVQWLLMVYPAVKAAGG